MIQFVSSLTWAPAADDGRRDLLVGYGVNDCRGAVARLPVKAVLDFATQCGLDDTLASYRQGFWNDTSVKL